MKSLCGLVLALACAIATCSAHAASAFLYVLNSNPAGNAIYGYAVNETTGALTLLGGFPLATGGTGATNVVPPRLTIDRLNQRLYGINSTSHTLAAYSINPATGALTALPYNGFVLPNTTNDWSSVQVHPSGSPLVMSDRNGTALLSYNVSATAITAATGSPYDLVTVTVFTNTFSPDGLYLYSGGGGTAPIAVNSVDPATGILAPIAGSPFTSSVPGVNKPKAYCIDSQGRLFTSCGGNLQVFTTTAGLPVPVTNNPFNTNLNFDQYAVLTPDEGYYIIADPSGNQVGVFQISGVGLSTALFINQAPFPSNGTGPNALAITTSGNFLYADNRDTRNIITYSVNKLSGVLTQTNLQAVSTNGAAGRNLGMDYLPIVDLGLTIVSNPGLVTAGSAAINLTYTIVLSNAGPSSAKDVKVQTALTLPSGVSIVGGVGTGNTTYDPTTKVWTVPSLDVGATATLTLSLSVGTSAPVGLNQITATATVKSVRAGRINVARGTATTPTNVGTTLISGPIVSPPIPLAGQPATFSAIVAGTGVTYMWDFGDGSTGTGSPITHTYATTGTYLVTLTIFDGINTYTSQALVTVNLYSTNTPYIGTGPDTDGDGFSDAFEIAYGSNPQDAASTPFSGAKAQAPAGLNVLTASIKLNFKKGMSDTIRLSGSINVPAGFQSEGKVAFVVVGNVLKRFQLNTSGAGKDGTSHFKISAKGRNALNQPQTAPFSVTMPKGDFAAKLNDYGLLNDNVGPAGLTVPISMYFNGGLSQQLQALTYLATKGQKGSAKK